MNKNEVIVLGGGCFWCTEAIFKMLKGVVSVEPGYAGGTTLNPTYQQVSNGNTGPDKFDDSNLYEDSRSQGDRNHAEVIKIEYDPQIIPLETLLTVFFATHDPTTKNRQGNDVGEQYRSIILYENDPQKTAAEKFIKELNTSNEKGASITTEVKMLQIFYPAEDYHKNYYANNKNQAYCQVVINPKLKKVQEKFAKLLI